ncbi:RING-H2 finger protein ATL68 [Linum grandiflorum]
MSSSSSSSAATAVPVAFSPPTPFPPTTPSNYLTNLGLGYSIAIAFGFLVLLSTILLASYICCRHRRSHPPTPPTSSSDGIILPRVIFVAEDDDDDDEGRNGENSVSAVGLDPAVINSYPRFQFLPDGDGVDTMCSICLCEYKDLEMMRMMPECRHFFHLTCLDAWLKLNGSCPVCRNSPLPTPLSTPLSEVVPLSQHAADRRRR